MNTICPLILAKKIHGAQRGEADTWITAAPRRREILWFIQWSSLQIGGLPALVRDLVERLPECFQSAAMLATKPNRQGLYSVEQCLAVWSDFGGGHGEFVGDASDFLDERAEDTDETHALACSLAARGQYDPANISFAELLDWCNRSKLTARDAQGDGFNAAAIRSAVERFNRSWLMRYCASLAAESLPRLLLRLCTEQGHELQSPSFCPELEQTLLAYMDARAESVGAEIAETIVTKTVRRELEFALSEGVPVPIVGESRFGKTRSVENWCQMWPGRVRLVTVPESNDERSFMRAHADALGLAYHPQSTASALKDKVEYILARAGLGILFDEAHFLVSQNYTEGTPPRRLNWIRARLIDRGVTTAFFATPQSYEQTLAKYAESTGYRIEQWLGRVAPTVILSDVIPFDEIVAVARTQFPELPQALLERLADRAILSDGYLKSLELAGKRARFLSRERGHATPDEQDVLDACADMMPTAPRVVSVPLVPAERAATAPGKASATSLPSRCTRPFADDLAADLAADPEAEFSRRSHRPDRVESSALLKV